MAASLSSSVAEAALVAKRLAQRNRSKRNLVLLAGALLAVLCVVTYFLVAPTTAVGPGAIVLAVAFGACAAGLVILRFSARLTPALASCPSCGQSWEIKEGRGVPYAERMPYWDKCPGCGLPMRTELLERLAKARDDA